MIIYEMNQFATCLDPSIFDKCGGKMQESCSQAQNPSQCADDSKHVLFQANAQRSALSDLAETQQRRDLVVKDGTGMD